MEKYTYKIGRRKTSSATIRLFEGKGDSQINEQPVEKYATTQSDKAYLFSPLKLLGVVDKYYFTAKVRGGGKRSQIGAIRHALARALAVSLPEGKSELKKDLMLRRDDRMTERKKTGLRKARKQTQYSKR